jgi:hypothetical protein
MNKSAESIVFLLAIGMYIALPVAMVLGWVRWVKRAQPRTLFSTLSLIGFALATASGVLAISSVLYAYAVGFRFYDPLLLRIFRWGALLSLAGIVFAVCGAWRPNPLRWYAPACALGMLLFWFIAAAGE